MHGEERKLKVGRIREKMGFKADGRTDGRTDRRRHLLALL